MPNYALDEYNRIRSPEYAQGEIQRRFQLASPELQARLASIRAGLAKRGLFSTSPVTRATYRAGGELTNQITSDVFSGIDERTMQLIQILTQLQEAEKARKDARSSSLFGGIGNLLGTLGGGIFGWLQNRDLMKALTTGGSQ